MRSPLRVEDLSSLSSNEDRLCRTLSPLLERDDLLSMLLSEASLLPMLPTSDESIRLRDNDVRRVLRLLKAECMSSKL